MRKFEILNRLKDERVVAVVRGNSIDDAIDCSLACARGGIRALEVTYTNPDATEIIKRLKNTQADLLVGAGTVLDSETARIAILAGAEYIVSPCFDGNTAKLCNRYQIPYLAGCMTITEIIVAMESGCDIIKLFPGSSFGPSYVKSIKAPLPQVNIMPTGGVDIDNMETWFRNGVMAVGIGGNLCEGTPETIEEKARKFAEKIRELKENKVI